MKHTWTIAVILGFLFTATLSADSIPYPNPGTQSPNNYSFTATSTGAITAYFDGSGASYTEVLGLLVNGVPTGIVGLNNHSTPIGQSLDLGNANAGDSLDFFINVLTTGNTWYSNTALNSDGANHVYSTSFSGSSGIPAGTYVGFEDLAANVADYNYTDEQFVFTNTTTNPSTPEPATAALCGLALLSLAAARRRKVRHGLPQTFRISVPGRCYRSR